MIKRYNIGECCSETSDNGDYCLFSDHEKEVTEERAKARQEGAREAIEKVWDSPKYPYRIDELTEELYVSFGGDPALLEEELESNHFNKLQHPDSYYAGGLEKEKEK